MKRARIDGENLANDEIVKINAGVTCSPTTRNSSSIALNIGMRIISCGIAVYS